MPISSFVTAAMEPVLLCLWTLSAAHLDLQAIITEMTKKRLGSRAIISNEWSTMDKLAQHDVLSFISILSPWIDISSAHV